MHTPHETSSAETTPSSEELAGILYVDILEKADTIGELRTETHTLASAMTNPEIAESLEYFSTSLDTITVSGQYDTVGIEELPQDVLGQNRLGQSEAVVAPEALGPAYITEETTQALNVVLHEASDEVGHAGQDPLAHASIIVDQSLVDSTVIYEGHVVTGVADETGEGHKNLPEDVYQEGADHVEKLGGHDAVGEYVTIGGAEQGNHLQLLVWENDPSATPKSMIQDAGQLGIPHDVVLRAITKKFPEYAEVLALVS
jgi:hypothetical protein